MSKKFKVCNKCGLRKAVKNFYCRKNTKGVLVPHQPCKTCHNKYIYDYQKARPAQTKVIQDRYRDKVRYKRALDSSRRLAIKFNYMPCTALVAEIKAAFTGRCHICKIQEKDTHRKLCLDHNHRTGKFRGWLCNNCNHAIGLLQDSPRITLKAYRYIRTQG